MSTNAAGPGPSLGVVCNAAEWRISESSYNALRPTLHCLTRRQSIALIITTEASFASMLAVLIVFALIVRNVVRCIRNPQSGNCNLIKTPADVYMLSLFVANLVQAVGMVLNIKWIMEGKTQIGSFCTAQGMIQQLGETPVAMNTIIIAIHTFVTVWWKKALHARTTALVAVACIWTYVILFISIGVTSKHNYMTPTPYWCWIGHSSFLMRIAGEYAWIWAALVTSVVLYVPLFFWSQGNITVLDRWWKFKIHRKIHMDRSLRHGKRVSLGLLAYPLTCSFIVLPLSVVRWIAFVHGPISLTSTFLISIIYGLSGCANVLLVLITRPQLLLFGEPPADRGRARTPSDTGTRAARRRGPLPSDSPSPPRERNSCPARAATATGGPDDAASRLGAALPRVTVTPAEDMFPAWPRQLEDGYNPHQSRREGAYPLATRARARQPTLDSSVSELARPAPAWRGRRRGEGGLPVGMGAGRVLP